jgi:hypothetical protein
MEIAYEGSHKVGEADFAGVATAIMKTGCDVLMMGTAICDTITLCATVRQVGWGKPVFPIVMSYTPIVALAGGGKLPEGVYLSCPVLSADLVIQALDQARPYLTMDNLIGGLEQAVGYNDMFGGPLLAFQPEKRASGDSPVFVQIQGGVWAKVQDRLAY